MVHSRERLGPCLWVPLPPPASAIKLSLDVGFHPGFVLVKSPIVTCGRWTEDTQAFITVVVYTQS